MSGEEGAGPGEGGAMLTQVFDYLRGMREQQRRDSKQLEQATSLLLGLTDQVRRMDRRLGEMDRRMGEQKDDLELMLKAELLGQFGMLRAQLAELRRRMTPPGRLRLRLDRVRSAAWRNRPPQVPAPCCPSPATPGYCPPPSPCACLSPRCVRNCPATLPGLPPTFHNVGYRAHGFVSLRQRSSD